MRIFLSTLLFLCFLTSLLSSFVHAHSTPSVLDADIKTWGALTFTPCVLEAAGVGRQRGAWCSTLLVPESPRSSRTVSLALTWLPTSERTTDLAPLLFLAGGPGQGARRSYPGTAPAFAFARKARDVLLLDVRGTGFSDPLTCAPPSIDALLSQHDTVVADVAHQDIKQCMAQWSDRDLTAYGTQSVIEDMERLRQALEIPAWHLLGVSYGTRVAQAYAATWPAHVVTLTLDGVVPPDVVMGQDQARHLDDVLFRLPLPCAIRQGMASLHAGERLSSKRGAPVTASSSPHSGEQEEAACTVPEASLGDLVTLVKALVREKAPPASWVLHAKTGHPSTKTPSWDTVRTVVRLHAYHPWTTAILPHLLLEAARGNWGPLLTHAQMLEEELPLGIARGAQWAVLCAEDLPLLRPDPADTDRVLGAAYTQLLALQCPLWPQTEGAADAWRHLPPHNVPTVLLSGELDPTTPPAYAERVAQTLKQTTHWVVPGHAHHVLGAACMPRLWARFLDARSTDGIETTCLTTLAPTPLFSGAHGWTP